MPILVLICIGSPSFDIGASLSKTRKWRYTLRKILLVYTDEFLGPHCAVGKIGSKNEGIEPEELGALKGEL